MLDTRRNYCRYDVCALDHLRRLRDKLVASMQNSSARRDNFLIWAPPGEGKTFLIEELARSQGGSTRLEVLNLAKVTREQLVYGLKRVQDAYMSTLCLIDEIDARPEEKWPYDTIMPALDLKVDEATPVVFIMAGSSGGSLDGLLQAIEKRYKGADLVSRVPKENWCHIPSIALGDRVLILVQHVMDASSVLSRPIKAIDKLGLYYWVTLKALANARQLREAAVRAVERMPKGGEVLRFDYIFEPGDPDKFDFWLKNQSVVDELKGKTLIIDH